MTYDASPHTAETPLSIEEVDALIAAEGKGVLKDSRKFMHMVRRMRIAIVAYRQQIRALNNDIQAVRLQQERTGAATTLNPRDAVRYLAPDQLAEVVEGHLREKLGMVERSMKEAQAARSTANGDLARIRFAATSIIEDPQIPEDVRKRFEQLIHSLPSSVAEGSAPASPGRFVPGTPATRAPRAHGAGASGAGENLGDLFT